MSAYEELHPTAAALWAETDARTRTSAEWQAIADAEAYDRTSPAGIAARERLNERARRAWDASTRQAERRRADSRARGLEKALARVRAEGFIVYRRAPKASAE